MSKNYHSQIKDNINGSVWTRSSGYGNYTELELSTAGHGYITATVQGSDYKPYKQRINQSDLGGGSYKYTATCNCPYGSSKGDYCKHIGAVIRKLRTVKFDFEDHDYQEVSVVQNQNTVESVKQVEQLEKKILEMSQIMSQSEVSEYNKMIDMLNELDPSRPLKKLEYTNKPEPKKPNPKLQYLESIMGVNNTNTSTKESWYPDGSPRSLQGHYLGYNLEIEISSNNKYHYQYELEALKISRKTGVPTKINIESLASRVKNQSIQYVTEADKKFLLNKIFATVSHSGYYSYTSGPSFNLTPNQFGYVFGRLIPSGKLYINNAIVSEPVQKGSLIIKFEEKAGQFWPKPQIEYTTAQDNYIITKNDFLIGDDEYKYFLALDNKGVKVIELQNLENMELLRIMMEPPQGGFDLQDVKKVFSKASESKTIHIPEKAKTQTIQLASPKTRIRLSEQDDMLELRVGYHYPELEDVGIALVYPDGTNNKVAMTDKDGVDYFALRDETTEKSRSEIIAGIVGPLAGYDIDDGSTLVDGDEAVKLIFEVLPLLEKRATELNLEIYGQEKLKKHNYLKASVSFSLKSGVDWLGISGNIQFGDTIIDMAAIAKMVKRRERFIQIGSSVGVLPEEWLQKHREIFALGQINDEGELQVSKWHLSILSDFDQTLATKDNKQESWQDQIRKCLNWSDIKKLPMPATTQATLRPYQQYGFEWLNYLYDNRLGGILADDMGLGKTLQTITFLDNLYNGAKKTKNSKASAIGQTLLVLPTSLIVNWQMELARFAPLLTFDLLYGNKRDKDLIKNSTANVLITTYGTLLRDIEELKTNQFECVILDEAQQIKNSESLTFKAVKLIKAKFRLSLSGTPVENSLGDLWSQFSFLNPGMLGSKTYFKTNFSNSQDPVASAKKLQQLTYPFILRRLKQDVAKELGDKVENILYVEMEPAQAKVYEQLRDFYQKKVNEDMVLNSATAKFRVLEGLTKLRQVCSHPRLLDGDSAIPSAKLDLMLEKLDEVIAEKHNVLIFSQFTSMLAIIQDKLKAKNIPYCYLDGKTKKRQAEVDKFQNNPDIPVFLISLKAGGVGLNLTAADYVFIFDPWWNPASENQAIDRAHRIGQDKTVFVYRYVVKDTVEEKILELQATKQNMVKNIITADESLIKSLNKKAINRLFS